MRILSLTLCNTRKDDDDKDDDNDNDDPVRDNATISVEKRRRRVIASVLRRANDSNPTFQNERILRPHSQTRVFDGGEASVELRARDDVIRATGI
jgi:hypothetical protein